ncbi:MAG: DJ-1/PfpI family protein [Asgard group archaeon]|nr:DJ-1/PfpI family protein [Asgard group archaeon]
MINTYFLLFNGFSGYEMIFPAFILRKTKITTVGLSEGVIVSEENLNFTPDIHLSELNTDHVDVFIIPGGSALQHLKENSPLIPILNELNSKGKIIAAICGGPVLLSNTNVLANKQFTAGGGELPEHWQTNFTTGNYIKDEVVVDANLITAKGKAVASFAVAIGKEIGVFQDEEAAQREYSLIQDIS